MTSDALGDPLQPGDPYLVVGRVRVDRASGRALIVLDDGRAFDVEGDELLPPAELLVRDGSRALTGPLDMGGNDVGNLPVSGPAGVYSAASAAWVLSSFLLQAQNLADLANAASARTNLGLGNAATLDVGTTSGTVAAGDHQHQATFVIWAEESSAPSVSTSSGYQWSFGNGATGSGTGITLAAACELTAVSLRLSGASPSVTVEVYANGVATGAVCSSAGANSSFAKITPTVSLAAGDHLTFRTTAVSGTTGAPNSVAAWLTSSTA